MTSKTAYLAAAAIALALPASAIAQSSSPRIPGTEPALPTVQAPSMNDRVAPGGLQPKPSFESSDLRGKNVYDPDGKKVGSIDDVVPAQGQPREAIVAVGGILGIGAKKVLIPATDIERSNDGRLVVAMSENQIEKLPEFERPRGSSPSALPDGAR
jgi:sporulation protein YlmC with PRC-barrel domain